jgi:hypothetical protein
LTLADRVDMVPSYEGKMDDPNKKKQDATLVSKQPHEVQYLCDKFGVVAPVVIAVIESHGPSRAAVEAELSRLAEASRP